MLGFMCVSTDAFAQQNTLQNKSNFLLHSCLVRCFVASKPVLLKTSQFVFFVVHFETLTNTELHITLFAFYLHSLSYLRMERMQQLTLEE
jgi:hypothetical protein